MATNLKLRIHSVKCLDETGGRWTEKAGNDEIYLGGFLIGATTNATKIDAISIYPHFDDGDIKRFSPPKVFATFDLGSIQQWPKNLGVGFLLIEKDGGGMAEAIDVVLKKVNEEIAKTKSRMAANVGRAGTTAMISIPWTVIMSHVYPPLKSYIKDKIVSGYKDDIFPLTNAETTILSPSHTWNGSNVSPIAVAEFRGHEGVYQLAYDWELS